MQQKLDPGNLYPLLFTPIYKQVMWGGDMLSKVLDRTVPKTDVPTGEAWEIVDRDDAQSIVENGPLKGLTLRELIKNCGSYLLGEKICGQKVFPLLVKIIDAGQKLSLQVHPDEICSKKIPGAEPKTEMWYIIAADRDAKIYAGLSHKSTRRRFLETCQSSAVEECLQIHKSLPGDAYMINAGTVHAIGAGNLLLEVQQNSNTTYRISDWGRVDADGKPRELHLEEATASINFMCKASPKISGVVGTAEHNRKFPIVQNCIHFKVDDLRLASDWADAAVKDSFHILTAINNPVRISSPKTSVEVMKGRSCLVPAHFGNYVIHVQPGAETTVIKTYL